MRDRDVVRETQTLILGAGPAGLQLGYFLRRAGRDVRILEAGGGPGTFFRKHPRNRTLISINKRYTGYDDPEVNLRWDWNSLLEEDGEEGPRFTEYSSRYFPSADTLVEYLEDFTARHRLPVEYDTRVERVGRREDGRFEIETDGRSTYLAERLVVATGVSRPYVPEIPGIEHALWYADAPADPEEYADQHVLILGKGNSGFEMADELIASAAVIHVASPESIRFAWRSHHVGHLRAINNNFLDTYQLKCQNAVLDATVERIRRLDDGRLGVTVSYSHAEGEREELTYDRVINCTGFRFDDSIFAPECRPELTLGDRFPAQTPAWESINVPDLFFAGTLMQVRDYKKATSSFIHGFRYNIRTLHRFFERRYHGRELPWREAPTTAESLADAVLERVNRTSALWQQFAYLGDLIVLPEAGAPEPSAAGRWYEELPVDWVCEGGLEDVGMEDGRGLRFLLTLEFGPKQTDPFRIERQPDPEQAGDSAFLHPVVRRLEGGETVAELHLLEHLYAEWWDEELHRRPLLDFFERELAGDLAEAV